MIKIERTEVYGWESAIHGMRNPMNSWDKSDSYCECPDEGTIRWCGEPHVGPNDLKLMKQLVKAGTDHSKFMRMINVTCDITAPLYWWKEFDTYKVGTVRNSCSTMHKIHSKEFTFDDFSHEHLSASALTLLREIIGELNAHRSWFNVNNNKDDWWQMIQLLPSSYNQRATVQMNYAVLRNMYHSRKAHELDEWREGFCHWVESLPHSSLITEEF